MVTKLSFRYPGSTFFILFLCTLFSLYSFTLIPKNIYPTFTRPVIEVQIPLLEVNSESFYEHYGHKIEQNFKKIDKGVYLEHLVSEYKPNSIQYTLNFSWNDAPEQCLREVEKTISNLRSILPSSIFEKIEFYSFNQSANKSFILTFSSNYLDQHQIKNILEQHLKPDIEKIKGVQALSIFSPDEKTWSLSIDPVLASINKINPSLFSSLSEKPYSRLQAQLNVCGSTTNIEVDSKKFEAKELLDLPVYTTENKAVPLSHIASLEKKVHDSVVWKYNQNAALIGSLNENHDIDFYPLFKEVQNKIKKSFEEKEELAQIDYNFILSPTDYIDEALNNLLKEIFICSAVAVSVLIFFLGTGGFSIFTLVLEIPLSLILSFSFFYLLNIDINLISLGGLALCIGLNIDASIVIIESISKECEKINSIPTPSQIQKIFLRAVQSVAGPLVTATLSSLVVFIPILGTSKVTYALMGDLALAIIISHTISLFISLTLIPLIRLKLTTLFPSSFFRLSQSQSSCVKRRFLGFSSIFSTRDYLLHLSSSLYFGFIKKLFYYRKLSLSLGFFLTLASILWPLTQYSSMKKEILTPPTGKFLIMNIFPTRAEFTFEQLEKNVTEIVTHIKELNPRVQSTLELLINQNKTGQIIFSLEHVRDFKELEEYLTVRYGDNQDYSIQTFSFNPTQIPLPEHYDWKVSFTADKKEDLDIYYSDFLESLYCEKDLFIQKKDFLSNPFQKSVSLVVHDHFKACPCCSLDFDKAQNLFGEYLRFYQKGHTYQEPDFTQEGLALIQDSFYSEVSKQELEAFPLVLGGEIIPIRALFSLEENQHAKSFHRKDGVFSLEVAGKFLSEKSKDKLLDLVRKTQHEIKEHKHRLIMSYSQLDPDLDEMLKEGMFCVFLSSLLLFAVLLLRFRRILDTLLILSALPFALSGGFIGLMIMNLPLSLNALLGSALLAGVSISNSLLLVERFNYNRGELSLDSDSALLQALSERLRPIMMTSLTTVLGLLPLALNLSGENNTLAPLGVVVSVGLWISLIFTLTIIPVLIREIRAKSL